MPGELLWQVAYLVAIPTASAMRGVPVTSIASFSAYGPVEVIATPGSAGVVVALADTRLTVQFELDGNFDAAGSPTHVNLAIRVPSDVNLARISQQQMKWDLDLSYNTICIKYLH